MGCVNTPPESKTQTGIAADPTLSTKSKTEIEQNLPEAQTKTGRRRTLLPWMGGKSRLAAHLVPLLPEHTTYVEPFCGGCAVFFRKERSNAEILNDRDDRLVTLLRGFPIPPGRAAA